MEHLTLDQLRTSAETGAVLGITLRASGAGFFVCAETRRGESTLITTRDKKPRRFVDSGKALRLLQALGIEKVTVNLTHWRPGEIEFERKPRPDRAAAMRETFDAAPTTVRFGLMWKWRYAKPMIRRRSGCRMTK